MKLSPVKIKSLQSKHFGINFIKSLETQAIKDQPLSENIFFSCTKLENAWNVKTFQVLKMCFSALLINLDTERKCKELHDAILWRKGIILSPHSNFSHKTSSRFWDGILNTIYYGLQWSIIHPQTNKRISAEKPKNSGRSWSPTAFAFALRDYPFAFSTFTFIWKVIKH